MYKTLSLTIGLISLPFTALLAHGGHGTGFMAGITHPILGLDHMVAIIAIAVLGYRLLEEKPWLPSGGFILAMAVGGYLGIHADALEFTELVIVGSVIATGVIIAFDIELTLVGFALMGIIFGFFHGHAHGVEMPDNSNIPLYVLGFVLGAILLTGAGVAIAKMISKPVYIQVLGGVVAGMGLMMLLG